MRKKLVGVLRRMADRLDPAPSKPVIDLRGCRGLDEDALVKAIDGARRRGRLA